MKTYNRDEVIIVQLSVNRMSEIIIQRRGFGASVRCGGEWAGDGCPSTRVATLILTMVPDMIRLLSCPLHCYAMCSDAALVFQIKSAILNILRLAKFMKNRRPLHQTSGDRHVNQLALLVPVVTLKLPKTMSESQEGRWSFMKPSLK